MKIKRIVTALAAGLISVGAAVGVGATSSGTAAAASVYYGSTLACVPGAAGGGAPDLSTVSSNVWWRNSLYAWNGRSWYHVADGDWHYKSNGSILYSQWVDYYSGAVDTYWGFTGLTQGGYYAVLNSVVVDGVWTQLWSVTPSGSTWCQA
jgi:hypothetical protein